MDQTFLAAAAGGRGTRAAIILRLPVYQLDERIVFPDPRHAEDSGLLAIGGDLSPERLLLAYSQGIFPWYNEGMPILWYSPPERMAMAPAQLHVPRSLAKRMRKMPFEIRFDTDFAGVIARCADVPRPDQHGTWITDEMIDGYSRLHELGFAHSVEAWRDGRLVGGLYGVSLGSAFFGESMFALAADASKVAFVSLVRKLAAWDFSLIDCQMYTEHLARFGATVRTRARFLGDLAAALPRQTRRGPWTDR